MKLARQLGLDENTDMLREIRKQEIQVEQGKAKSKRNATE